MFFWVSTVKFDTGDGIFRFAIKKEDERIPLSLKRAILLHSDTQSIDELQAFMQVKDVTLAQCKNLFIYVYGQSILYAFSHEASMSIGRSEVPPFI